MNFIRLHGLAAGTVSGRNNGLLRCYVEFGIRAKTGFSYILVMFKVGTKIAKIDLPTFFFDPPKNKKPSVQKVPPCGIYGDI